MNYLLTTKRRKDAAMINVKAVGPDCLSVQEMILGHFATDGIHDSGWGSKPSLTFNCISEKA